MRQKSENDFEIDLPGVGKFVYGQRTIGDFIAIRRRYVELAGENVNDAVLSSLAGIVATHDVMCVSCPEGWENLMNFSMANSKEDYLQKVMELDRLIGEKENSFRQDATGKDQEART